MKDKIQLSPSQQAVLQQILNFLDSYDENEDKQDVFILKGSAGTGKTTMIKYIIDHLDTQHKSYMLMAPTGRATKVLRDKLKYPEAQTIHSSIFSHKLEIIVRDNIANNSFQYYFPLISNTSACYAAIVDESSMISDVISNTEFLQFGSGRLLSDLLEYVKIARIKKLLFVGDPDQLPPVTDSCSRALDKQELSQKGCNVESSELTEVFRQQNNSGILDVATHIRQLLELPRKQRNSLSIVDNGNDIKTLLPEDLITTYIKRNPSPTLKNDIIISYSNRQCQKLNKSIREKYYPGMHDIQKGDRLLVNTNNYKAFGIEIYNGDLIQVVAVGRREVHPNIPVILHGKKLHVDLFFRHLQVLFPDNTTIPCVILENLLESSERDLKVEEIRALFIDLCMRYKEYVKTPDFKEILESDVYFNALRVKYGYAMTCHKSQGGEWDCTFVDFSGRCGLDDNSLRWCYTAVTRAKKLLYICNAPRITPYQKLEFLPIECCKKAPKVFFNPILQTESPFHKDLNVLPGVKMKCKGIIDALNETPFTLNKVISMSWQERYFFTDNRTEKQYIINAFYDKSGLFKTLQTTNDNSCEDQLRQIINKAPYATEAFEYKTTSPTFEDLYQRIFTICNEIGIIITNVVEELSQYNILYCLETDSLAYIRFYIKGEMFSTSTPFSMIGEKDKKLNLLIDKLRLYADK